MRTIYFVVLASFVLSACMTGNTIRDVSIFHRPLARQPLDNDAFETDVLEDDALIGYCSDSDGENVHTAGFVTDEGSGYTGGPDVCLDEVVLKEMICTTNHADSFTFSCSDLMEYCDAGRCVQCLNDVHCGSGARCVNNECVHVLPMTTASRTECVAPCAVFFDTIDVAEGAWNPAGPGQNPAWFSGVVQGEHFQDLLYEWDFGDPSSGDWIYGVEGRSKNHAAGPLVAHVYEVPGMYTVLLDVRDAWGVHHYFQDLEVLPYPGSGWEHTYYVAEDGNDANDGSLEHPWRTVDRAFSMALPSTRLLFKRGDEFAVNQVIRTTVDGPVHVDAYGEGKKPHFIAGPLFHENVTYDSMFYVRHDDWSFMNLNITGAWNGLDLLAGGPIIKPIDWARNTLMFKVDAGWSRNGLESSFSSYTTIYECTNGPTESVGSTVFNSRHSAILGSHFHDAKSSHNFYTLSTFKNVYSNNLIERAGGGRHNIRICGADAGNNFIAKYNVIADNMINAGTWLSLYISPNVNNLLQVMEDTLIERNVVYNTSQYALLIGPGVDGITVRNNLMDGSVWMKKRDDDIHPLTLDQEDVLIEHNTLLKTNLEGVSVIELLNPLAKRISIRNNILHSVFPHGAALVYHIADFELLNEVTTDHNVLHVPHSEDVVRFAYGEYSMNMMQWQALGQDSDSFEADPSYLQPDYEHVPDGNFRLLFGSPAIDAGLSSLDYDLDNFPRPFDGDGDGIPRPDSGAFEYHGCSMDAACPSDVACVDWSCLDSRCVRTELAGVCDDGIDCTMDDTCVGGVCVGTPFDGACADVPVCAEKTCGAMGCTYGSCDSSLVFAWSADDDPSDGSVPDLSPFHNDASCVSCPARIVDGDRTVYAFDGAGSFLSVPDNPSLDMTDAVSIVLWAKTAQSYTDPYPSLVAKGDAGYSLRFFGLAPAPSGAELYTWAGGVNTRSGLFAPVGEWNFLAVVFHQGLVDFYVNDESVLSRPGGGSISANNIPLTIARSTGEREYDGLIDDLYVFNRALSPAEIEGLRAVQ